MTTSNVKPETDQDLIDAIAALLENEQDAESIEDVLEELRAEGYEPGELRARMARVAEEAYRSSPHNWRQRATRERTNAEARLRRRSPQRERRDRSETLKQINIIIAESPHLGGSLRVQAHFRNLEQATDEDLDDLLSELEFLSEEDTP